MQLRKAELLRLENNVKEHNIVKAHFTMTHVKFFALAWLLISGHTSHAQEKLIDLDKTDDMKKHVYPVKTSPPEDVVLLNVSGTVTSRTPLNLAPYKNLQVLRIENSKFSVIEIDFDNHPFFQSLYFSNTSFDTLIFKGTPRHFKQLYLYDRHFYNYDFLKNLQSLEEVCILDTLNIDIDNFTENLLGLPKLHSLSFYDCNLRTLPASFAKLRKLDWLSLAHMDSAFNMAQAFECIRNIQLNNLNLYGCHGTRLPSNISVLKHIKGLYMAESNFTMLPAGIGELTQLEEIHASMSSLDSIPESMVKLTKLKVLGLMPCNFKSIPAVLYKMTWLKELEVGSMEWWPTDEELKPLRKTLKHTKVNNFGR